MINLACINLNSVTVDNVDMNDYPDFVDAYIEYAEFTNGTPLSDDDLEMLTSEHPELVQEKAHESIQ